MNQIEVLSVFVVASLCIVIFILNRLYERAEVQKSIIEGLVLESYKDKLLIAKLYEGIKISNSFPFNTFLSFCIIMSL